MSEPLSASTVTLTVSLGKAMVAIPDESGRDPTIAANDLGNLGLKTKPAFESSDTVQQGLVTRTDPSANSQVALGSTVTIYESTGPTQVTVPSVIGDTLQQAATALASAGFKVSSSNGPLPTPTGNGTVISQSPNAGTKAAKGATVNVVIGTFTPPTSTTAPTPASNPSTTAPGSTSSTT